MNVWEIGTKGIFEIQPLDQLYTDNQYVYCRSVPVYDLKKRLFQPILTKHDD